MQHLMRVVLSSFLPHLPVLSRRGKLILAATGAATIVLLAPILLRRLGPAGSSLPERLGLQPLYATDERGDKWTIEPAVAQPFARLQADRVKPGPPLVIRTDVQPQGTRGVSIGLTIEGRAGERYRPDLTKNGSPLPPPIFTIVNEAGKVIGRGYFKYG